MKSITSLSGVKNHSKIDAEEQSSECGLEVQERLCVEGGSICYVYFKERLNPVFSLEALSGDLRH